MPAKPEILFVTNRVPPDRLGAFCKLHERVPIQLALFGGRNTHATEGVTDLPIPHSYIREQQAYSLARGQQFSLAICGTAGRVALPATWLGAKRAKIPFILWSALWATPRSIPHLLGTPVLNRIYRDANLVITYGPHTSTYAQRRKAKETIIAPQAVDETFWRHTEPRKSGQQHFHACFIGRDSEGKGVDLLCEAWKIAKPACSKAKLTLIGPKQHRSQKALDIKAIDYQPPEQVRAILANTDVLVLPSLRTKMFREPWGLVINEAMHLGVPVIASTEVGAVAGGLVRHNRNGLVIKAGDPYALASALVQMAQNPQLRGTLGAQAARDITSFTQERWADQFAHAIQAQLGFIR